MARDITDDNFYVASGGKVPVKWTAPEVYITYVHSYIISYCLVAQLHTYMHTYIHRSVYTYIMVLLTFSDAYTYCICI